MPLSPRGRAPLPNPAAGQYLFTSSPGALSTSATLGVGTLRLVPWLIETKLSIDRLGAEVTLVGDAGSLLRLGIYGDTGNVYPGSLLLDAGTIAGDSATVQQITISTLTLPPGLYWVGGAVQAVTTTQPTVRTVSAWTPPVTLGLSTSLPAAGQSSFGFTQASVTGALPANFSATVGIAGAAPRLLARAA